MKAFIYILLSLFIAFFSFSSFFFSSCAESIDLPKKREFRAVWVATFHNIDWPSAKDISPYKQQEEFLDLVKRQHKIGMNGLVVQIRCAGDAFYPSKLAPWSEYLNNTQGQAPQPYYDPLRFMISAAHDRNMEFHAWFNPFRAVSHVRFSSVAQNHIYKLKPEWTYTYGNKIFLNPGIPAVRTYITQLVMEVVRNYDVDGIHFDDYFYPYTEAGQSIEDQQTFLNYSNGFSNLHDWRRDNIDRFIREIRDSLDLVKPQVKFGISPVGIWRNKYKDPLGSDSRTRFTSYDDLYADVRKWLQEGWIDYVAPQLYWSTTHPTASYKNLLPWWADNAFGRHLYIGHAVFKLKDDKGKYWRNPGQLPLQLDMYQQFPQVQGSIFYSENAFRENPHQLSTMFQEERYRYPALIPPMPWKDPIPPLAPQRLEVKTDSSSVFLKWDPPLPAKDHETASYYVVYRFTGREKADLNKVQNIVGIQRSPYFIDWRVEADQSYTYLVTSMDRLHNESLTCAATIVRVK